MTKPRRPFFGTIFQHSLFLAAGSAVAVAIASMTLVLTSRGPFYFPISTFEVARIIEGRPIGRVDPLITVTRSSTRPQNETATESVYSRHLRDALARNLGIPVESVIFETLPRESSFLQPVDIARNAQVNVVKDGANLYKDDPRYAPVIFSSFRASIRKPNGLWITVSRKGPSPGPQWQFGITRWIGVSVLLLLPITWLFSNWLARPIRTFAAAADRIGHGSFERVEIRGPAEIRTAAAALNEMQTRLEGYVNERTAVVGAIAHDLRTPLARLAFLLRDAPAALKQKTDAEVAGMDQLITVALDYVQSETATPTRDVVDLRLVAESVVDEFADMGRDVALAAGPSPLVAGDSVLLTRLVRNLVSNALFYGRCAAVSVTVQGADAVVDVDDDGPGIAASELERVFEPFYRSERSRNEATGGIGLGLAIVRSLARAHGGGVKLSNRPEGGLRARVTLPIAAHAAT